MSRPDLPGIPDDEAIPSILSEIGKTMNNAVKIEAMLVGPEKSKQRRAELLAHLGRALDEGGPQGVTDEMTQRFDKLVDEFAGHLQDLKKQL